MHSVLHWPQSKWAGSSGKSLKLITPDPQRMDHNRNLWQHCSRNLSDFSGVSTKVFAINMPSWYSVQTRPQIWHLSQWCTFGNLHHTSSDIIHVVCCMPRITSATCTFISCLLLWFQKLCSNIHNIHVAIERKSRRVSHGDTFTTYSLSGFLFTYYIHTYIWPVTWSNICWYHSHLKSSAQRIEATLACGSQHKVFVAQMLSLKSSTCCLLIGRISFCPTCAGFNCSNSRTVALWIWPLVFITKVTT